MRQEIVFTSDDSIAIIAPHPDDYDRYHLGVFTFRTTSALAPRRRC